MERPKFDGQNSHLQLGILLHDIVLVFIALGLQMFSLLLQLHQLILQLLCCLLVLLPLLQQFLPLFLRERAYNGKVPR